MQCLSDPGLAGMQGLHCVILLDVKQVCLVSACALGVAHGLVRVAQQGIRVDVVLRKYCCTNADSDVE